MGTQRLYNTKEHPIGMGFFYKDVVGFKPEFEHKFNVNENKLVVWGTGEDAEGKYVKGYIKIGKTPTGKESKGIIPCVIRVPLEMVVIL